jgi:phytanoyl-CoA hydroxylase
MQGLAQRLPADELRHYEAHGFVVVPDVFPLRDLEEVDRELDRIMAQPGYKAGDHLPESIMQLGMRSEITRRFCEDERILALIEDVVEPGIAIHSAKMIAKPAHSEVVCHWHQDEAFYTKPEDPATHSHSRMSVWVPMQDSDERNGCLWVVPGSHRWGLQAFERIDYDTCRRRLVQQEAYAREHAVPLPVPAGSVVLFHGLLWHHSKGNQTDRVRRAFIISYQEATVPLGLGGQWRILRPAA